MKKMATNFDLLEYMKLHPIRASWYGPRANDIVGLENCIQWDGALCVYDTSVPKNIPILTIEKAGNRKRVSIDDLAYQFAQSGLLESFVKDHGITTILPYDVNVKLEEFCKLNRIHLLSSSDQIKDQLRDKTLIDQISRVLNIATIPGVPGIIDDFDYDDLVGQFGLPLFLHFAEGAGGTGNRIVFSREEFDAVRTAQMGKRLNAKQYFIGKTCTIDICVLQTAVICGVLEEELIGAEPLNSNPTEYVGSSWFENGYSSDVRLKISKIGIALGEYVRSQGFLGCFHPDFLVGDDDEVYLTELNMRFGGSCGAYNRIQAANGQIPIFALHSLAFLSDGSILDADKINQTNLRPLNYALLVLKNYSGRSMMLPGRFTNGIYQITDRGMQFIRTIESFSDFESQTEILITGLPSSSLDTVIEEGAYICEVMTRFPTSDSNSKLNLIGKELVEKIYSEIFRG